MKIFVHDYAGHPFQVQLSRALARRGHQVWHAFSASNPTPQGALAKAPSDPESFTPLPVVLPEKIDKASFVKRRGQEAAHGKLVAELIQKHRPEIVISANAPLDAQKVIQASAASVGAASVYWVQDFVGLATDVILRKKLPVIGGLIGGYYKRLEEKLLRASDQVVVISEDFKPALDRMGVDRAKVHVIENWSPIDDIPLLPKDNEWSRTHGLAGRRVALYSGTLGFKHNPDLLIQIATELKPDKDAMLVVASEGGAANWVKDEAEKQDLANVLVLPFQPFSVFPQMLASADLFVAVLEPEAGVYSVPSKVLSYLCAGRAILLAVPPENLASRIVENSGAGIVVSPERLGEFGKIAVQMIKDADQSRRYGEAGRAYAEKTFAIESITDRFLNVFETAMGESRKVG